jgi:hypothetical protein
MKTARTLALVQGAYFAALGIWPLVSIRSFKAVSGEKTDNYPSGLDADHWLVFTVGALIAVVGFVLLIASRRAMISSEFVALGGGSALALGVIDVLYVSRNVIQPIYLADAALELAFLLGWIWAWRFDISPGQN